MSAATAKGQVGIIGLGIMGGAIAKNLAAAGWQVIGYDIARAAAPRRSCAASRSPPHAAAVAAKADAHPRQPAEARGADGDGARRSPPRKLPRRMIAELSTFSLDDKTRGRGSAARGRSHRCSIARSPGTGAQARTKDLVVYASGERRRSTAMMPVFTDFSRPAHDLGAFGNGMKMKFVANLLVAIHNVASAEAMVLGMKAGLDPAQIFKLIQSGAGNSRVFELRAPMMVEDNLRRRQPHHAGLDLAEGHEGDRRIRSVRRLPDAAVLLTEPIYRAALSTGHADEDTGSVCAVLEAMAGIKR